MLGFDLSEWEKLDLGEIRPIRLFVFCFVLKNTYPF